MPLDKCCTCVYQAWQCSSRDASCELLTEILQQKVFRNLEPIKKQTRERYILKKSIHFSVILTTKYRKSYLANALRIDFFICGLKFVLVGALVHALCVHFESSECDAGFEAGGHRTTEHWYFGAGCQRHRVVDHKTLGAG